MCPPTSFSDHRISASRKIYAVPQKDFFDSIDPKATFGLIGVCRRTVARCAKASHAALVNQCVSNFAQ